MLESHHFGLTVADNHVTAQQAVTFCEFWLAYTSTWLHVNCVDPQPSSFNPAAMKFVTKGLTASL
jgi:hypothetical protein